MFVHVVIVLFFFWLRSIHTIMGFPGGSDSKESICNAEDLGSTWVGNIPWRRAWQPTSIFLPGEFQGQRSLGGYNPWNHKESDTTEHLCIAQQHTYHYIIYHNFFFYLPIMDIWVITHLESFQIRLYGHLCTSLL